MSHTKASTARAARFRDRQRAKGLRTVTIWMPDIRDPGYRRRLAAACEALATLPQAETAADAEAGLAGAFAHIPGWQ